jgi:hypothetical protein
MAVVGPEIPLRLRRHATLLPELFHGLVIDGIAHLTEDDPRQFPIVKAGIQRFQPVDLLPDHVRDRPNPSPALHLDGVRQQPEHPVLPEMPHKPPDRVRVGLGGLRPLRNGIRVKEDERADHFIAPLDLIHEASP